MANPRNDWKIAVLDDARMLQIIEQNIEPKYRSPVVLLKRLKIDTENVPTRNDQKTPFNPEDQREVQNLEMKPADGALTQDDELPPKLVNQSKAVVTSVAIMPPPEKPPTLIPEYFFTCSKCYRMFQVESALVEHQAQDRFCRSQHRPAKPSIRLKKLKVNSKVKQSPAKINHGVKTSKVIRKLSKEQETKGTVLVPTKRSNPKRQIQILRQAEEELSLKFKCPHCDLRFATGPLIKMHAKSHPVESYACSTCGKVYQHLFSLRAHFRSPVNCSNQLNAKSPKRRQETKAAVLVHPKRQIKKPCKTGNKLPLKYKCAHCDLRFATGFGIKRHTKSHPVESYACSTCGKVYLKLNSLQAHFRNPCSEQLNVKSPEMSESKIPKVNLPAPDPLKKLSPKPYQCEYTAICQNSFYTFGAKRSHEYNFHKATPRACDFCGKSFSNANSLWNHKLFHHPEQVGNERAQCPHCPRFYRKKTGKSDHMNRFHPEMLIKTADTAKNAFDCKECPRTFRFLSSLKRHVTVDHRRPRCALSLTQTEVSVEKEFVLEFDDQVLMAPPPGGENANTGTSRRKQNLKELVRPATPSVLSTVQSPISIWANSRCELGKKRRRSSSSLESGAPSPGIQISPYVVRASPAFSAKNPLELASVRKYNNSVLSTTNVSTVQKKSLKRASPWVVDIGGNNDFVDAENNEELSQLSPKKQIASWVANVTNTNPTGGMSDKLFEFPDVIPTTVLKMEPDFWAEEDYCYE